MFDVLVAASAYFDTEFNDICCDQIELCIYINKMETTLYINNGEEDSIWGSVELSKAEFLAVMDKVYKWWREKIKHEYIVS